MILNPLHPIFTTQHSLEHNNYMKKIFVLLAVCLYSTLGFAQYDNTKIHIGQKAPDLVFKNPEGKVLKLSEINKKRVILLDFWASWCGPCRRSNPGLVALYKRYVDKEFKDAKKGFDIVSVSLDQDKEPWVNAIAKDSLYWPNHMSDLGGWQSKPAQIYGVAFIPQAFLLAPDGTVLGMYNVSEQAEADLQKLLK